MKIATFVPHNFFMSFEVVKCWLGIPKLPDINYAYFESCYIDTSRNRAVELARETGGDLLMIDSDMVFTPNDIMKMRNHLRTGVELISGVYPVVMEGEKIPCVYKLVDGKYQPDKIVEGVIETDAVGAGFLGISKDLIKRLPPDYFSRLVEGDVVFGEDVSFCRRVQKLGVKVLYDSSIRLSQVRMSKMELQ